MMHVQRHRYPDYTMTESGLQYQDLRPGSGQQAQSGSLCEVDWDGCASLSPAFPALPCHVQHSCNAIHSGLALCKHDSNKVTLKVGSA